MKQLQSTEHLPEYWEIIKCDSTRFLSSHTGYESRLYHGEIEPDAARDVYRWGRALAAGVVRLCQGLLRSAFRKRRGHPLPRQEYVLLITVGGPKYASEERQIVEACRDKGLGLQTVYLLPESEGGPDPNSSLTPSMLTPGDYARAFFAWLWRTALGSRYLFLGDAKKRSLFVASINGIRQDCVLTRFAHRIIAVHGAPRFVLSLAPSAAVSVTVVKHMKQQHVLTAAMRTQTTHADSEYFAINADILFCKGVHERQVYETVFDGLGPRLEDGCVLSLPERYELEALHLPEKYALLLGVSPRYDQSSDDGRVYEDKLCRVASAAGLVAVLKTHNLAADWGHEVLECGSTELGVAIVETDMRRNRELIDRASLVASHPSTLLYYALLKGAPVVIVEAYPSSRVLDEFLAAPIHRIGWEQPVDDERVRWPDLEASAAAAKSWFEENYFLQKDGGWVIEYLLQQAGGARAGTTTST